MMVRASFVGPETFLQYFSLYQEKTMSRTRLGKGIWWLVEGHVFLSVLTSLLTLKCAAWFQLSLTGR